MELNTEIKIDDSFSKLSNNELDKMIKKAIVKLGFEWQRRAVNIIMDESADTGEFANSVHFETFDDDKGNYGFTGMDGVNYGVYHEFGTVRHWVPFYSYGDTSKPILADWGKRVLGLTEEEMIKKGGMYVEIKETKPFMRAMTETMEHAEDTFLQVFGSD